MTKGISIYLDLLRFGLALIVWICHSTFRGYTGHPFALWFIYVYGVSAVMGFFVLSGFVIAHVTATTEKEPLAYTIARISRLYSVVIPALLLTFVCDTAGTWTNPPFQGPVALPEHLAGGYLASFFMVNDFWMFVSKTSPGGITPGTNGPFWSLSYEIVYYIVFGLFLSRNRIIFVCGTILIFLLAGPYILALFPLWLLGVAIYQLQRSYTLPIGIAVVLFPLSMILMAKVGWLRQESDYESARSIDFLIDYGVGFLMAINILAASSLSRWVVTVLGWCEPVVRWLGGLTFVIYLCHFPLLKLFAAFPVGEPGSTWQDVWLFGGGFVVMAGIAKVTDHGRRRFRTTLRSLAHSAMAASHGAS
jgi:peptidoglycan/LPS O-acetylase OafA/YrhL